jgi:hypothetical protein
MVITPVPEVIVEDPHKISEFATKVFVAVVIHAIKLLPVELLAPTI